MNTFPRVGAPALALLLLATSCSTPPPAASVAAVASDTATLIADIEAAAVNKSLTVAQLQIIGAVTGQLSTDVASLNAGNGGITASKVLADVTSAISDVGPFLPTILALISTAAPSGGSGSPAMVHYQQLKIDVAKAG